MRNNKMEVDMRIFPIIVCCALALATVPTVMAGNQGATNPVATPPALSDAPLQVGVASGQATDKNGNPMTPDAYNRAADARMKDRTAATQSRLEKRQAKWKKAAMNSAAATK